MFSWLVFDAYIETVLLGHHSIESCVTVSYMIDHSNRIPLSGNPGLEKGQHNPTVKKFFFKFLVIFRFWNKSFVFIYYVCPFSLTDLR
jgi:hypothetical protein